MAKNKSLEHGCLACSFGFDFKRRGNLTRVRDSVVAYTVGNLLTLRDVKTQRQTYLRSAEGGNIGLVAVDGDGTHIAIGENGAAPRISIYSYPSLELVNTIHGGAAACYSTGKFSPDGQLLASVSGLPDYWLTLWDWKTAKTVLRAKAYGQEVFDLSFLGANSERMITHGAGHIQFWQMVKTFTGLKLQGTLGKFNGEPLSNITCVLELPFNDMILTSTEYGALLIWVDGRVQYKIMRANASSDDEDCHGGSIETMIYINNGSVILTAGDDGWVREWNIDEIRRVISSQSKGVVCMKPISKRSIDGANIRHICALENKLFIQDSGRGLVCSLDDDDMERPVVSAHSGVITACETSLNSTHLITCDNIGEVHCYDYLSRAFLYKSRFSCSATALTNVPLNVNEDGRCIVVGFADGVVRVLVRNTSSWRLALALKPHAHAVEQFTWSSDGEYLAIAAANNTVFIFSSSSFASTLQFEPIGFIRLSARPKKIFWDGESIFGAQIEDEMHCFAVHRDLGESRKDSYEIDVTPRITTDVETKNAVDESFSAITYDNSYCVKICKSGSFEVHALSDASPSNTHSSIDEALCIYPEVEAIDTLSAQCASIEEVLQRERAKELSEEEAAALIRLSSLVALCRDEFNVIIEENAKLPREMRISGAELLVDDTQMRRIREDSVHWLKATHDKLQSSVMCAESVSNQLQKSYYDKIMALPRMIHSSSEALTCSSFALRAGSEGDWQTTTVAEATVHECEQEMRVVHVQNTCISENAHERQSIEGSEMSSEARRRFERLRRNEELRKLEKAEPLKDQTDDSEALKRDNLGDGFPLRCVPDSRVPPEDKLTTEGKLSELRYVDGQLRGNQSRFNREFDCIDAKDAVTDEDLISLCHLKADIIARSKVIELSRIVVHRELSVMPEYDVKNTEMQNAQRQAKEEVETARAAVENAQTAVNDQQTKLEGQNGVKAEIEATFDKFMIPGVPRAALLKVFHKRVVNKTEQKSDKGDSDSDLDSDFDDDSYYSSSDEENGDTCPKGCDSAVYERVCDLRLQRIEAMDAITEIQRALDGKKKIHDAALKKLRSLEENVRVLERDADAFEKVKQQSLNGLRTAFVLPVSCVETSQGDMDDMIIFSKTRLAELENKVVEWDAEVLKLKRQQQELKREHSSLIAQRSAKAKEFQSLQRKYSETQIRKFGKLIVLEDLDKVVNNGQGTEDLRDKLKVQELENARELREIKKDISNVEREVLNLTEAHTTCLNELLALRSVKV